MLSFACCNKYAALCNDYRGQAEAIQSICQLTVHAEHNEQRQQRVRRADWQKRVHFKDSFSRPLLIIQAG